MIFTLRVLSVFDRNYQIAGFVAEKGLSTACSQFRGSSASQSDYSYANQKNQNESMLIKKNQNEWKSFDWRLHWEKCGEILFFSKILCFLEKSLLSFREKSYFFEKKTRFSHDFSQYARTVLWLFWIWEFPEIPAQNSPVWQLFSDWFKSENSQKSRHRILLYESCSLIGLNPGIPKNLGIEFTTCSSTYNFQFSDPLKLKKLTFPNPQKLYRYSPCISEYTSRKNHVFINRSY